MACLMNILLLLLLAVTHSLAEIHEVQVQSPQDDSGTVLCEIELYAESGRQLAIYNSKFEPPSQGNSHLVVDSDIGYDEFGQRTTSECTAVQSPTKWSGLVDVDVNDPVTKMVIYSTVGGLTQVLVTLDGEIVADGANDSPVLSIPVNVPPLLDTIAINFSTPVDRFVQVCDLKVFASDGTELLLMPSSVDQASSPTASPTKIPTQSPSFPTPRPSRLPTLPPHVTESHRTLSRDERRDDTVELDRPDTSEKILINRIFTGACVQLEAYASEILESSILIVTGRTWFTQNNPPVRATGIVSGEGLIYMSISISSQFPEVTGYETFKAVDGTFDVPLDAIEACLPDSDPNNCPPDKYGSSCSSDVYCDTTKGTCEDCTCYGKKGNGACTSCIAGWYGSSCSREIDLCETAYADCDGPCELSQSTTCTCMDGVESNSCDTVTYGDIMVLLPSNFNSEGTKDFLKNDCSNSLELTKESIKCFQSPGQFAIDIVCNSAQSDPVRAGEALLAVLSCIPRVATETQDTNAGFLASSGTSTAAMVANALEKRERSNLQGGKLLDRARLLAETFAFAGYPLEQEENSFLVSDLQTLDRLTFMSSRLPTKEACLGVCPCGTRLVVVGIEPVCQPVTKSEMLEISMNYLRCASFPTEVLVQHSLATRSMFLSASFHCLNELIVEDNASRDATDTKVNPILKAASDRLFSRLEFFSSTDPVLASSIGRVGSLLSRDFLNPETEQGNSIFRVPPLNKEAYKEQLEKFTDELFKMEQRFAVDSLEQLAETQFVKLRDQIENLRVFTSEELRQLRSNMNNGFELMIGQFQSDAETVLNVVVIKVGTCFKRSLENTIFILTDEFYDSSALLF